MSDKASKSDDGRLRRGASARAVILAQAMNSASIDGLAGLTFGSLAQALSINKSNITILFGDKLTLQLRTLDAAAEVFDQRVVAPNSGIASPCQRLTKYLDAWFRYVEERVFPGGCLLVSVAHEFRARPGPIQDLAKKYLDDWGTLLVATVRQAKEIGEVAAEVDPQQMAFELMSFQSLANTASLLGEQDIFYRARTTVARRIALART
jgi:AcrR family transcriptional regulator